MATSRANAATANASGSTRVDQENAVAQLINEYNTLLAETLALGRSANYALAKTNMLMKQTEREDYKVSLQQTERMSFLEMSPAFDLVERHPQANSKEKKEDDSPTHNKKPVAGNPLRIIKGGYAPLGIRESHENYKTLVGKMVEVVKLRHVIYTKLNSLDSSL